MPVRLDASSIPRHAIAVAINAALIRPDVFVVSFNIFLKCRHVSLERGCHYISSSVSYL